VNTKEKRDQFLLHLFNHLDFLKQLFNRFESAERRGQINLGGFLKALKFLGFESDLEHQVEFSKYSKQNRVKLEGFIGALRDCYGGDEPFF
jgi:hypothetical protein